MAVDRLLDQLIKERQEQLTNESVTKASGFFAQAHQRSLDGDLVGAQELAQQGIEIGNSLEKYATDAEQAKIEIVAFVAEKLGPLGITPPGEEYIQQLAEALIGKAESSQKRAKPAKEIEARENKRQRDPDLKQKQFWAVSAKLRLVPTSDERAELSLNDAISIIYPEEERKDRTFSNIQGLIAGNSVGGFDKLSELLGETRFPLSDEQIASIDKNLHFTIDVLKRMNNVVEYEGKTIEEIMEYTRTATSIRITNKAQSDPEKKEDTPKPLSFDDAEKIYIIKQILAKPAQMMAGLKAEDRIRLMSAREELGTNYAGIVDGNKLSAPILEKFSRFSYMKDDEKRDFLATQDPNTRLIISVISGNWSADELPKLLS